MRKLVVAFAVILLTAGAWNSSARAFNQTISIHLKTNPLMLEKVACVEADTDPVCPDSGKMILCKHGMPKPDCDCVACPVVDPSNPPPEGACSCPRGTCCKPFGVGSYCCRM